MNNRPGPHEGSNEHLADAGDPSVVDHDGPTTPDDGLRDDLTQFVRDEPRLAAFLDRSADVLRTGPDEFTAHRHLVAMRKEAAAAVPARPRVLRTASISAAAAVALVVTLAGFGALPAPAQQVLSDVADRVGITIPSPADHVPGGEVPAQQHPDPETVPGRPGGPDRSELPGADDGHTSPGPTDGHSGDDRLPKQDRDVPVAPDSQRAPSEPPAPDPSDQAEQHPPAQPAVPVEPPPDKPEQAPSPPAPPDPPPRPEPPDVEDPPASGRGSGPSGQGSDDGHTGDDGGQSSRSGDRSGGNQR